MGFSFSLSYAALWGVAIFQGLVLLALLRKVSELEQAARKGILLQGEDRLPLGSRAPEFDGIDEHSGQAVSSRLFSDEGGILVFLAADCVVCKGLARSLAGVAQGLLPGAVVFCVGREQACIRLAKRAGTNFPVVLRGADEAALRYRISSFPAVVALDKNRNITGYGHPETAEDIEQLWIGIAGERKLSGISDGNASVVGSGEYREHAR